MKLKWICPECEFTNELIYTEFEANSAQVQYCNVEEGGCDTMFVITPTFKTDYDICSTKKLI